MDHNVQAREMIYGKNVIQLMDPNLMENFSIEEATIVLQLASQCLQYEYQENPNIKDLVATLETLQTKTEVPSDEMLDMKNNAEVSLNQLSPLGEACSRMDLVAIHKILVKAQYEDDKEVIEVPKHISTDSADTLKEAAILEAKRSQ